MASSANRRSSPMAMRPDRLRMAVLVTLVVQNSAQALFMRYAFKPKEDVEGEEKPPEPASSTAVMMAEVTKLVCSLLLQYRDDGSMGQMMNTLREDLWGEKLELLKMAVPACLYVFQNNLNYIAISNLDGPTFQLMYQLKILTTAIFSVVMLERVLLLKQWGALAMLALGVGLVQMSSSSSSEDDGGSGDDGSGDDGQDALLGLAAVLMACCTSGFAGVYFEKVLKGTSVSLWVRNMQLSGFSVLLGAGCVWFKDGEKVAEHGFFYGYDYAAWMAVLLNSLGGLIVAMVVKYADNVIKGFATSVSIVLTSLVSFALFGFDITFMFVIGAYLVLHSTFLYSQKSPSNSSATAPAPSVAITGTTNGGGAGGGGGGGVGDVELPEQESLLQSEGTASPRPNRLSQTATTRKNSVSSALSRGELSRGERDTTPV